ncbi:hypothetical protein GA0115243_104759 [Streptomyces sp. ScaeMP-e83]|nr:hypothetical protein GA0115243_104759 [Streptomyces sp. ScaeMP-e83]
MGGVRGHLIDGETIPDRGRIPKARKEAYTEAKEKEALRWALPHLAENKTPGVKEPAKGSDASADSK